MTVKVKPFFYSKYHRTVIAAPKVQILGVTGTNINVYQKDTMLSQEVYPSTLPLYLDGQDQPSIGAVTLPGKETINVVGKFVTRDFGDGINDSLLQRVIMETIPRRGWVNYNYAVNSYKDPKVKVELRSAAWTEYGVAANSGGMERGYIYDLIARNQTSQGSRNVWFSYAQGPSDPTWDATLRKINFEPDDIEEFPASYSSEGQIWRESLNLNAPLNSRFRRMRIEFESVLTQVVRSVKVMTASFIRRSG